MITTIARVKIDENTGFGIFYHTVRGQRFVVEYSNIHPSTGEVIGFYLEPNCLSQSEILTELIDKMVCIDRDDFTDEQEEIYQEISFCDFD